MSDDEIVREIDYFSPWLLAWVVLSFFSVYFWDFIVRELPRNKTWVGRLSQLLVFLLISLVSFLCFVQTLRASPYTDFGFYLSIMGPVVVFYATFSIFGLGVVRTIAKVISKRAAARRALRDFLRFHYCVPLMQLAFAAAHSCWFGLALSAVGVGQVVYESWSFPPGRRRSQREKWE
jgi:ABC-type multidrug transport system permease subunit